MGPFLTRAIQKQCDAGQDVAAEEAAVAVGEQVSAAEGFLQEDHVQIDGLGGAAGSVEADQIVCQSGIGGDAESRHRTARKQRGISTGVQQQKDIADGRTVGGTQSHLGNGCGWIVVQSVIAWHQGQAPRSA